MLILSQITNDMHDRIVFLGPVGSMQDMTQVKCKTGFFLYEDRLSVGRRALS